MTEVRARPGSATPGGSAGVFSGSLRATTAGLVLVITFVAFEVMAVATAMPTAVRELDGLAAYGWAFTSFLVTNVVGMVVGGEQADRWGARRPLLVGLVTFAAGLVLAGLAPAMVPFVLGRAVQGFGSGLITVAVYVVIGDIYPEQLRPRVFAALSAAWVLPSLVGPVVAGFLAEQLSWRLVFLGLPPFVALGTVLLLPTLRRLPTPSGPTGPAGRRWPPAVATAAGVALVQFAGQHPVLPTVLLALPGVVLLITGLRRLLPPGTAVLRRGVPAVVALRGVLAGSFFAIESLVPLTLTVVHGFSATAAGAPLTLGALGWASASWWQGRHGEVPRHLLVRAGLSCVAVAAVGMALVSAPSAPGWLVYPVWMFGGLGAGLAMPSLSVLLLALAPATERGVSAAALQISDAVSSALTIGLAGVLVAATERGALSLTGAAALVDLLMGAFALSGAVLATRARGRQEQRARPSAGPDR